ncbi:hypothetical protein ACXX82_02500 [Glaciimonas sp. GNP009]
MKLKTYFELSRWVYYVLFWLITMGLIAVIGEFLAGPFMGWLLYDIPYQLPTWNRIGRWSLGILFIGFFAGSLSWFYEKRSSGR